MTVCFDKTRPTYDNGIIVFSEKTMPSLVTPEALSSQLTSPDWVLLDVRASLTDPDEGRRAYEVSHLPGARFVDFDQVVCGHPTETSGRHPLPKTADFLAALKQLGISRNSRLVLYDDGTLSFAARLWFQLALVGLPSQVLDGGFSYWKKQGLPLTDAVPQWQPTDMTASPTKERVWTTDEILKLVEQPDPRFTLIDARPRERYLGHVVTLDPVAGHIPGTLSLPGGDLFGADGRLLSFQDLRAYFEKRLGDRLAGSVILSCGSGVRACTVKLAMEQAGLTSEGVYVDSFSGWIRDPRRPVTCEEFL